MDRWIDEQMDMLLFEFKKGNSLKIYGHEMTSAALLTSKQMDEWMVGCCVVGCVEEQE